MKLEDKLKNSIPLLTGNIDIYKKTVTELLDSAKDEKEKKLITEFIIDTTNANTEHLIMEVNILLLKLKLNEYNEIIPYTYIAKHYFNKSKAWLSQRINGYDVNRKKAKFTKEELEIFNFALQDVSKKIGSITLV